MRKSTGLFPWRVLPGAGGDVFVHHLLYVLAVLHDVVAFHHLQGENDARVAVVHYVTLRHIVFSFHLGHVPDAHRVVALVGEDDGILNLLLIVHSRFQRFLCISLLSYQ